MFKRTLCSLACIAVLQVMLASCRPGSDDRGAAQDTDAHAAAQMSDTPAALKQTPPAPQSSRPAEQRAQATADVRRATIMRVEGVAEATTGSRLANYLIRTGTERPLSQELLNELVVLVRSRTGFDDSIVKRCRPGTSVGLRLFRTTPADSATNKPVTELVLDFGCDRLTLAQAGATDILQATYFDPSRAAFLAFVKRALPNDRELSALR